MKNILLQLLPVLILVILFIFVRNEISMSILILLAIMITFKIKYYKKEIYVFIFGFVLGILLELFASFVLAQSWDSQHTFPIWLPLTWGYGFVLIRRIGNMIVKK